MNTKKSLFLDTATQIARHWHTPAVRSEISQQLEGCKLYCSQYVKCQYKATLVESAKRLHNLCLRSQDLLEAIQKAKEWRYSKEAGGKLTPGVLSRIVDISYWISRYWDTFEEQVLRIQDLIEDSWEVYFDFGLELPLIDETGCVYAEGDPVIGESGAYEPLRASCTKDNPPECRIHEFWDEHKIQLAKLANIDIKSIKAKHKDKKESKQVKEHARKIMSGKYPWGRRCRDHLSDAVICIESIHCPDPESVAVHSINKKHFQPLGEVLGVESEPKD